MAIGLQTLFKIRDAIEAHLQDYSRDISDAYSANGNELSISFAVKMAPGKKGGTDYEVSMTFVKDRVRVRSVGNIDEKQFTLPFPGQNDMSVTYTGGPND